MKNANIFDTIASVVVTNYPNNELFAIVRNDSLSIVKDYHAGEYLYRFDVINGKIKQDVFLSDIEHVNIDTFKMAIRSAWYKIERDNNISIGAQLLTVNDNAIRKHCIDNNVDNGAIDNMLTQYHLLLSRIAFVDSVCKSFNCDKETSKTVNTIVSVYHDNTVDGYTNEIDAIKKEIDVINAAVDKDNNQLNIKSFKDCLSKFAMAVWTANDNDGIDTYTYNANTRLCLYVLGNCRKLNRKTNKWNDVSVERLVCEVVVAMIARLYELKHIDEKQNNK